MVHALYPAAFSLTASANNRWTIKPEFGTAFSDVVDAGYYAHIAPKLRVGDILDVYPEGADYYAELYVDRVGKMEAHVLVLRKIDLGELRAAPALKPSTFSVEWRGPKGKFTVVRDSDTATIKNGFGTKEEAEEYIAGMTAAPIAA